MNFGNLFRGKKLFYGWYIVIAAFVLAIYHSSVAIYGMTAFVTPIITTFGWSYAQLSLATSLRGLESGLFNPVWGVASDRYSPRKLMIFGVIMYGAGLFCLGLTKNLAMYYAGFLIMGLGSSLITGILPATVMARWFRKNLGKANGLFYMGMGIGGALVPILVKLIDNLGWQPTLMAAAVGLVVIGILSSFVYRSRPADYGLFPDGRVPVTNSESKTTQAPEFGTNVKEALKTRAFWHLVVTVLFQNATIGVVTLFSMPYLTSLGMTRETASQAAMLYPLFSIFTRIPMGILADTFKTSYVIALSVVMQGIGLFIFWMINGTSPFWVLVLFAVFYGIGLSGVMALRPPILVEYFGTKNFGAIFGLESVFITIAGVVSAPLAGWVFDTYGSYKPFWLGLIVFAIIALIAILTIPKPRKRTSQGT